MVIPLIAPKQVVTRVDYQICDNCGFRLMRVETTIVNEQRLITKRCPICRCSENNIAFRWADPRSRSAVQQCFDDWLFTHGLNRETLEKHYHLRIEDFFEQGSRQNGGIRRT